MEKYFYIDHTNKEQKKVFYTNTTEFIVEVGKGPKGSYETRYRFVGNPAQAFIYYDGINIGNGYKKRLKMDSKVLARQFSY